jgi:hypothetical protein
MPIRPNIIRLDDVHFRPDPPLCREVSIQLAPVWTSQQPVRTPLGTRPVSDYFQVLIKERSINRPDDVVSRPDACLLKARIAIQISPSGRLLALVRTRSEQIWKLCVEVLPCGCSSPWSGRAKPYKEITCSGRTTVRTRLLNRKDFSAKFLENPVVQLSVQTDHVHRPDGAQLYFA